LAQIYNGSNGVPRDPERAKAYTAESSDLIVAGSTLNIAALAGLTNQVLQAIVGGLVKNYNPNDLLGLGRHSISPVGGIVALAGNTNVQNGFKKVGTKILDFFSSKPSAKTKGLVKHQKKVKSLLADPTDKNITSAKKELISWEEDLNKLGELWPTNQQPAEFGQIKKLVQETETDLAQNLTSQAGTNADTVVPLIEALQTIITSQTNAPPK